MFEFEPEWVSPDVVWLRIAGTIDLESASQVAMAIALLEAEAPGQIVIDLRDVDLVDSAGLRVIVDAETRARRDGRSLTIAANPEGIVRRLLTLTTLDMRIPVIDGPAPAASHDGDEAQSR